MCERVFSIPTALLLALVGVMTLLSWLGGEGAPLAHAQGPDGYDTYYVAPGGDCGGAEPCYASVQAAVDAVDDPGDVVKVAAGTYTGVQGRPAPAGYYGPSVITQVVYISQTVTVRGGYTTTDWATSDPEANPTTLDAQGQGRVLFISGQAISPTIEGLWITRGDAAGLGDLQGYDAGGGVYVVTATAIIRDNYVFSNTADYGGGLVLYFSNATLSGNTVSGNTASGSGGGLYLYDSHITLTGNTVSGNTANYGGGLSLSYSDATLSGNTVSGNTASWSDGGGLYLYDCYVTLSSNTVSGNTAGWYGGGLYLSYSDATLSENTVSGNTAERYSGGGLYLSDSDATLSDNAVGGNTAGWNGGGLHLRDSEVTLNGNTVSGNAAGEDGGGLCLWWNNDAMLVNNVVADNEAHVSGSGLYVRHSSSRLLHNTIARNTGGDGSGVYVSNWGSHYGTVWLTNTILVSQAVGISVTAGNTVTLEATLWGSGDWANGTDWAGEGTLLTGTVNVWGDPAFVDADAGDYHLSPDSAAIDRGVDAGLTADIDGHPRPIGLPDLGADEWSLQTHLPLVMRGYRSPLIFPLPIGDAIPVRAVAYQGEVFYTAIVPMPEPLPSWGRFYFSSQRDAVAEVLVDDELAVLLEGRPVFTYRFSSEGHEPEAAVVEVPRAVMEQLAGRVATVEYRDVYGVLVQASAVWLLWTP
jgi:parallel beta-helix repeat protein